MEKKKRQQYFQADSYSRKTNTLLKLIINLKGKPALVVKSAYA